MDISNRTYESQADADRYLYVEKIHVSQTECWTSIAHFHDSIEFIFVVNGSYGVHINAEEQVLQSGEGAFIDSFVPHFYFAQGEAEGYAVVIGRQLIFNDTPEDTFQCFLGKNECFPRIISFVEAIGEFASLNDEIKVGFANTIVGLLRGFCPIQRRSISRISQTFVQVLQYINRNFRENITLKSLAARFGYDPNYFSLLFNKFTDMHLKEYLNRRRINEVMKIKVSDPSRSLAGIAFECGFLSEKTFYRAYKQYKK